MNDLMRMKLTFAFVEQPKALTNDNEGTLVCKSKLQVTLGRI